MSATFQRGEPRQVMLPVALAKAVGEGGLVGVSANTLVNASDTSWDTSAAITRKAFVKLFVGASAQEKAANENVYGNSHASRLFCRIDCGGVRKYAAASGTYNLFDLVGPSSADSALLNTTVTKVTDPEEAIGRVVGLAGTNPEYVEVEILSRKCSIDLPTGIVRQARIAGGSAGDLTVTGIKTTDKLVSVIRFDVATDTGDNATGNKVQAVTNIVSEFTVSAANTINNVGGTDTTGDVLLVTYLETP